jgi:hypothetical protein
VQLQLQVLEAPVHVRCSIALLATTGVFACNTFSLLVSSLASPLPLSGQRDSREVERVHVGENLWL